MMAMMMQAPSTHPPNHQTNKPDKHTRTHDLSSSPVHTPSAQSHPVVVKQTNRRQVGVGLGLSCKPVLPRSQRVVTSAPHTSRPAHAVDITSQMMQQEPRNTTYTTHTLPAQVLVNTPPKRDTPYMLAQGMHTYRRNAWGAASQSRHDDKLTAAGKGAAELLLSSSIPTSKRHTRAHWRERYMPLPTTAAATAVLKTASSMLRCCRRRRPPAPAVYCLALYLATAASYFFFSSSAFFWYLALSASEASFHSSPMALATSVTLKVGFSALTPARLSLANRK